MILHKYQVMTRTKFITILFLMICISVQGQETNSVAKFEGRGLVNDYQTILDLSYQDLEEVPVQANNPAIEILILDNNNIQALPNWISSLVNLKVLSVRNNNLTEVNSAISFCENLEQIYLSGNANLTDLTGLSNCRKLKIIDVIDTGINEVPGEMNMMDNLSYFKFTKQ
jgi:Leucine-rich repeat (LRR) protein